MAAVKWRTQPIRYAIGAFDPVQSASSELQLLAARRMLSEHGVKLSLCHFDIIRIIYHLSEDQIPSSDAQVSRPSIMARRAAGLEDMRRVFVQRP